MGVQDHPQWLGGARHAPGGEVGVVGAQGARAGEDRVGFGAQPVDVGAGLRRRDPAAGSVGGRGPAVESRRVLPGDVGAAEAYGGEPGGVARFRLVGEQARRYFGAGRAQGVGAAGGLRVRVADRVFHTGDTGVDECLGAGSGPAGVVAGFQRDVRGAAARSAARGCQCVHFGVRPAGPLVEALAHGLARRVEDDAAYDGIGAGGSESARRERDGSAHGVDRLRRWSGCGGHRVLLPLRARTPGPVDDDRERDHTGTPGQRSGCDPGIRTTRHRLRRTNTARRALPPIRTFTVGPGITPGQPPAGCGRVADYNRRFGITPTPECAAAGTGQVCHVRPSAMRATCCGLAHSGCDGPVTACGR